MITLQHIERHVCSCCGLVFNHKLLLDNHFASKHCGELPYPCKHCTRLFPTKTARSNHSYIAHRNTDKGELKYQCKDCKLFFEMKEELRIHSFIHFNGEIKTCLDCNQIFKTTRLLNIHMQKHDKKKSLECQDCGTQFTFTTGLAKHLRLNRCRGPSINIITGKAINEMDEQDIADIALKQLKEITQPSKKFAKVTEEINIMENFGEEKLIETESEDDFENSWPQVKIEDAIKEEKEEKSEVKETRSIRKKKQNPVINLKKGRAHLVYTCDFCGEKVKFKKEILNHLKQHVNSFKYKCKECEEAFRSRKKLIDHSWEIHGTKPRAVVESFACEVCDMKFDIRSIYETHKLSHDDRARNHVCSVCSAAFKSIGNLRRHEATHVKTRDYQCAECAKMFKTQLALKIHSETVHTEFKIFVKCSLCSAMIQEKHLKIHMKNQHTEQGKQKPFSCTICFKTFKTEKLGQRHYEAVHDPKFLGAVYVCSECPSLKFYRHRDLKEHSFVHFDGVIHQCEVCLKMFKNKRLLMAHSAVHSEEAEKYPCEYCVNVVFRTRGGRRKHILKLHSVQQQPGRDIFTSLLP